MNLLAVVDSIQISIAVGASVIGFLLSSLVGVLSWSSLRLVRAVDRLTERVEHLEISSTKVRTELDLMRDHP